MTYKTATREKAASWLPFHHAPTRRLVKLYFRRISHSPQKPPYDIFFIISHFRRYFSPTFHIIIDFTFSWQVAS